MKRLAYYIRTVSPVIINAYGSDRNMINTLDYIPGRTVLGALATKYIYSEKLGTDAHKNETFKKLFLSGKVRFLNAYPLYEETQFLPSPLYLRKKKDDEEILLTFEDKKDFASFSGYVAQKQGRLYRHYIEKAVFFHNTRGANDELRIKGHSEDRGIFNYEAIAPFSVFKGYIIGNEKELEEISKIIGDENKIRVGKSRLVQYGDAEIKIGNEISDLHERDNFIYYPSDELEDNEVVLTLLSDMILYNDLNFFSADTKDFENYLKEKTGMDLHIKRSLIRKSHIEKFVNVWHLKTPTFVSFSAGSSFLIECSDSQAKEKLKIIVNEGLGLMNSEGFGEAVLTLPETETNVPRYMYPSEKLKKKKEDRPKNIRVGRVLSKQIVKEIIKKYVISTAYTEAKKFEVERLPSSSLLAKLEFLSSSMDGAKFVEIISDKQNSNTKTLPENAIRQLEKARNKTETLKDYIRLKLPNAIKIDTIKGRHPKIKKLCEELGIELDNKKFEEEIFRLFWPHFFRALRKMKKEVSDG